MECGGQGKGRGNGRVYVGEDCHNYKYRKEFESVEMLERTGTVRKGSDSEWQRPGEL